MIMFLPITDHSMEIHQKHIDGHDVILFYEHDLNGENKAMEVMELFQVVIVTIQPIQYETVQ